MHSTQQSSIMSLSRIWTKSQQSRAWQVNDTVRWRTRGAMLSASLGASTVNWRRKDIRRVTSNFWFSYVDTGSMKRKRWWRARRRKDRDTERQAPSACRESEVEDPTSSMNSSRISSGKVGPWGMGVDNKMLNSELASINDWIHSHSLSSQKQPRKVFFLLPMTLDSRLSTSLLKDLNQWSYFWCSLDTPSLSLFDTIFLSGESEQPLPSLSLYQLVFGVKGRSFLYNASLKLTDRMTDLNE